MSGTVSIVNSQIYSNTAYNVRTHVQKFPSPPMGDSSFACCLQGGGVEVRGGTVSFLNSQIYSNTATYDPEDWFSGPTTPKTQLAVAWVVMLSFLLLCGSLATAIALTSEDEEGRSVMRHCLMLICILFGMPFLICIIAWGALMNQPPPKEPDYVRAHAQKFPLPRWENC